METAAWKQSYLNLLAWVQGQGPEAGLLIVGLQALVVMLIVPGPYFTLGAGFLFGTFGGGVAAVGGSALGSVLAYWIARGFSGNAAGEKFRRRVQSSPKFRDLGKVLLAGGWRVVLVTRLAPLFPFKLSNYFFGWVRFPFLSFFWGTLIGIIPNTMVSVSAGSLIADLSSLMDSGSPIAKSQIIWSALGLGLAVIFVVAVGYRAKQNWMQLKAERGGL